MSLIAKAQALFVVAGAVLMVCTTLKARGVKEASVLNLGSLHADLAKPSSQTGWTPYLNADAILRP